MSMPKELEEEMKAMAVPKVEMVTREGKPTSIDDYDSFMQFLMLASIASQAVKIRKYFDDRTSEGLTENFPLAITDVIQLVRCTFPAQSIFIVNDGPNPIFLMINKRGTTPTQLNLNENIFIDFETHKLLRFYINCIAGGAATARAVTKR